MTFLLFKVHVYLFQHTIITVIAAFDKPSPLLSGIAVVKINKPARVGGVWGMQERLRRDNLVKTCPIAVEPLLHLTPADKIMLLN